MGRRRRWLKESRALRSISLPLSLSLASYRMWETQDIAQLSSEDEAAERHPDSIRTKMKRIIREALLAGSHAQRVEGLCGALAGISLEDDAPAPSSTGSTSRDCGGDVAVTGAAKRFAGLTLREDDKSDDCRSYRCLHCGHIFARAKTCGMHMKVCAKRAT